MGWKKVWPERMLPAHVREDIEGMQPPAGVEWILLGAHNLDGTEIELPSVQCPSLEQIVELLFALGVQYVHGFYWVENTLIINVVHQDYVSVAVLSF